MILRTVVTVCPNITLQFLIVAIFKSFVKQSNDREISSSHGGEYDVQSCRQGHATV
jgi:hypothetical protein